jgi:hypothetical protein
LSGTAVSGDLDVDLGLRQLRLFRGRSRSLIQLAQLPGGFLLFDIGFLLLCRQSARPELVKQQFDWIYGSGGARHSGRPIKTATQLMS